jgi:hypothetical protein
MMRVGKVKYSGNLLVIATTLQYFLTLCFLTFSGCATDVGKTTQIGAATGGVIGAGLGAIVGSQTGNPGAGLAVGAAAGSLTGGAISNNVEAQNQELERQAELIRRQDESIATHRSQLSQMRDEVSSDTPTDYYNKPLNSNESINSNSINYQENPSARYQANNSGFINQNRYKNISSDGSVYSTEQYTKEQYNGVANTSSGFNESENSGIANLPASHPLRKYQFTENGKQLKENKVNSLSLATSASNSNKSGIVINSSQYTKMAREEALNNSLNRDLSFNSQSIQDKLPKNSSNNTNASLVYNSPSEKRFEFKAEKPLKEERVENIVPESQSEQEAYLNVPDEKSVSVSSSDTTDSTKITQPQEELTVSDGAVAAVNSSEDQKTEESGINCEDARKDFYDSESKTIPAEKLFHLKRALRLCPSEPQYHVALASVYRTMGNDADAAFEYHEALSLDPDFEAASIGLKELSK